MKENRAGCSARTPAGFGGGGKPHFSARHFHILDLYVYLYGKHGKSSLERAAAVIGELGWTKAGLRGGKDVMGRGAYCHIHAAGIGRERGPGGCCEGDGKERGCGGAGEGRGGAFLNHFVWVLLPWAARSRVCACWGW